MFVIKKNWNVLNPRRPAVGEFPQLAPVGRSERGQRHDFRKMIINFPENSK